MTVTSIQGECLPPRLLVQLPDGDRVFPLVEKETTIGRDPSNRICIADPLISAFHAKIVRSGDTYSVIDLGSANKTRVNGRLAVQASLRHGDHVLFAGVSCRLLLAAVAAWSDTTEPSSHHDCAAEREEAESVADRFNPRKPRPCPVRYRPLKTRTPRFKLLLVLGVVVLFSLVAVLASRVF